MQTSARERAFTLIELLIVVSIVTIMAGITIPRLTGYTKNQDLKQAQEQVKNDLRTVQNRALSGVGTSNEELLFWGIDFDKDTDDYSLISCKDSACNDLINTQSSEKLPGDVVLKNSTTISFSVENGDAFTSNYTVVLGTSSGSICKGVNVNGAGLIKKVEVACP
jgi:prepilin-type N-terminal cleavage/methylation domain-containing protein